MPHPVSPIGDVVTLRSAESRAEFTTVGAHLRSFRIGDRDVIVPFGDDLPWGAHGAVLAPWPNRLDEGRYTWQSATHSVEITEPERNTAIHGLVHTRPWSAQATGDRVRFALDLPAVAGYPFPLRLSLTYTLAGHALSADFSATNIGTAAAPFGVGFHPWLAAGPGGLERATLEMDTGTWFRTDARLLPIGEEDVPEEFDFRVPRVIGDARLDDAFGAPTFDAAGRSWIRLVGDDGVRVSAWMEEPLTIWQVCTDPGPAPRPGIAAEPMSCPANAFRSGDRLTHLAPGETFRARWGLTAD